MATEKAIIQRKWKLHSFAEGFFTALKVIPASVMPLQLRSSNSPCGTCPWSKLELTASTD